jgi:hypothetical protein
MPLSLYYFEFYILVRICPLGRHRRQEDCSNAHGDALQPDLKPHTDKLVDAIASPAAVSAKIKGLFSPTFVSRSTLPSSQSWSLSSSERLRSDLPTPPE